MANKLKRGFDQQARSQPVLSGKPGFTFCLSCNFIFRNERNWMKKSARVSEKLVSPGLPGLQVATRLINMGWHVWYKSHVSSVSPSSDRTDYLVNHAVTLCKIATQLQRFNSSCSFTFFLLRDNTNISIHICWIAFRSQSWLQIGKYCCIAVSRRLKQWNIFYQDYRFGVLMSNNLT